MSKPILHIDRISKQYQLGVMGSGALKKDLQAWWNKQVLHKKEAPDPEAYDEANRDYIWALRNLDFKIHEGDSFGIVGNNGSGKSTLLKIAAGLLAPDEGTLFFDSKKLPSAAQLLVPGFKDFSIVNQDFKLDL